MNHTDQAGGLLTASQREAWVRDGYLHLRNVLAPDEVAALLLDFEGLKEESTSQFGVPGNHHDFKLVNTVALTDRFDALLDHPGVFGKVLSLMGPYIQIAGTEAMERYPSDKELVRFHTDGGASLRHIFPSIDSLTLNLKVQFFLTDVLVPDSGNFAVIPGSQYTQFPDEGISWEEAEGKSVQILAKAGDALLFPWSVWHGVAPNKVGNIRKSVFVRYSQLWCRPADYVAQSPAVLSRMTPRRRRLLGAFEEENIPMDYYRPTTKHNHLPIMLGDDWSGHPELLKFGQTAKFFHQLEQWKWDR